MGRLARSADRGQRLALQRDNSLHYLYEWGLSARQLRVILKELGYSVSVTIDDFDQELADALISFQETNCLRHIDGVFGPLTYTKMSDVWSLTRATKG